MLCKIVILLTLTVICVSSQCDQECRYRQYTRDKRGKLYSSPPIRFYNLPPKPIPVQGPFSYTPPPFKPDEGSSFPGRFPYKVSKRLPPPPINNGLGDDDINNLVKYLSKQDLDKLLEFAQEKDQSYNKYRDVYNTNEYTRPYKRESRIVYKGNNHAKYEEPTPYKEESFVNYVTEPSYIKAFSTQEGSKPYDFNSRPSQRVPDADTFSPSQGVPNDIESFSNHDYVQSPSASFPVSSNYRNEENYVKVFTSQEQQRKPPQVDTENYSSYQGMLVDALSISAGHTMGIPQEPASSHPSNNLYYTESNEEEKLPRPVNMREEDYDASNTNNVPKIVQSESSTYDVKNFGDLPLMDYNSKLHDVSSYHVPHYTVTQPKPASPPISFPSSSYSSPSSSSSSSLLKPSPAAGAIKEPVYERAPSIAAAAEHSDAHLKAVKIWSHKSKGAAYTLHDDGTLTPERSRPQYG